MPEVRREGARRVRAGHFVNIHLLYSSAIAVLAVVAILIPNYQLLY